MIKKSELNKNNNNTKYDVYNESPKNIKKSNRINYFRKFNSSVKSS